MQKPKFDPKDMLAHTPYISPKTAKRMLGIKTGAGLRSVASSKRLGKLPVEWRIPDELIQGTFDQRTVLYWRHLVLEYLKERDAPRKPVQRPRRANAGTDPTG